MAERGRGFSATGGAVHLIEALQETFLDRECVQSVRTGIIQLNPSLLGDSANSTATVTNAQARMLIDLAALTAETGVVDESKREELKRSDALCSAFVAFYDIISCAIRGRVVDKVLAEDLKKMLFPQEIANTLISIITSRRAALELSAREKRVVLPSLKSLDWRVDVTITTTQLNRVFKPTVLFQMGLSDGKIRTFEASIEKFHQLRFNVARMLATMLNIEQHPTLKRLVD